MYIIDYKFQVLHFNKEAGKFFGTSLSDVVEESVVRVPGFPGGWSLRDHFIFNTMDPVSLMFEVPGGPVVTLVYDPAVPCVAIKDDNGKYLSLDGQYEFARDAYQMWEYFWLADESVIREVQHFASHDWISARDGRLYKASEIKIGDNFQILIGTYCFDLRLQAPEDFSYYEVTGIVDGWKPEKFLLYKPLVYITAFSAKSILGQLQICVRSLRDIGKFNGKIVVMTDKTREEIADICEEKIANIEVDILPAADFVGYVCSKFSIYQNDIYNGYQPLLYLDPDIVFDREIEPMLVEATATRQICLALEVFHRLQTHPPVGGSLLQLDLLDAGPFAAGANGGTIIVPNVVNPIYRENIDLIARTLTHVGLKFGRRWSGWADQEALNYIGFKLGHFNTTVLTKYAQFVDKPQQAYLGGAGFIHYWGHTADRKVEKMRDYLAELYAKVLPGKPMPPEII